MSVAATLESDGRIRAAELRAIAAEAYVADARATKVRDDERIYAAEVRAIAAEMRVNDLETAIADSRVAKPRDESHSSSTHHDLGDVDWFCQSCL